MEHNIEYEKKLLNLLNYQIITNDNNWIILDDKNKEVGFIKYLKLFNDKEIYGYHMEIESDLISYNNTRFDNQDSLTYESYNFLKKEDDENIVIDMVLDGLNRLNVWSQKYGFFSFVIEPNSIYLSYKSSTPKFNIEEIVRIKICNRDKWFSYIVNYIDKEYSLDYNNPNLKAFNIDFKSDENIPEGNILIEMNNFENGMIVKQESILTKGNMKDAIKKQELAINAFNTLKEFINKILPFKEDIIDYMCQNINTNREELKVFINNDNNTKTRRKIFNRF